MPCWIRGSASRPLPCRSRRKPLLSQASGESPVHFQRGVEIGVRVDDVSGDHRDDAAVDVGRRAIGPQQRLLLQRPGAALDRERTAVAARAPPHSKPWRAVRHMWLNSGASSRQGGKGRQGGTDGGKDERHFIQASSFPICAPGIGAPVRTVLFCPLLDQWPKQLSRSCPAICGVSGHAVADRS